MFRDVYFFDPTDELLPNSTHNKAFYINSIEDNNPDSATTEFSDSDYNKTNVSDDSRFESYATAKTSTKFTHQKFEFNLSSYDINSLTEIRYCHEGYYYISTGLNSFHSLRVYNVSQGSWFNDQDLSTTETVKCNSFTSGFNDLINSTSGIFKLAATVDIGPPFGGGTGSIYLYTDFVNLSVSYSVTDSQPPTYSLNSTNNTVAGKLTEFRLKWSDNLALNNSGQWQAWLDNCTGTFVNVTPLTNFTTTPEWTNFTAVINDTAYCTIRWFVNASDNAGNWNNSLASNPFSFVTLPSYCDVVIDNTTIPYTINQNNTYYCLSEDIGKYDEHGIIVSNKIQNSTIDCLGRNINHTGVSGYEGIIINGTETKNITVKNCVINDYDIGIDLSYSSNNTLLNNTLNSITGNMEGCAFYFYNSSGNALTDNKIISSEDGFCIYYSENNNITNGSVHNSLVRDYQLSDSDVTNYFRNTNFTDSRKIYFNGATSWFSYNNRTDIELWLKTNVSAQTTITRKLLSWSKVLMKWNDSADSAVVARYNITGLNPNKYYLVYNNSELTYTLQTDSQGNLPSFTIYLSSEHEIKVEEDLTPPQYSLNSTNSTIAGTPVLHSLKWTDNTGLSHAIFSFDNCTGSLQNISTISLSGTEDWSNFTVGINSTVGCTIRWCVYVNDTSDNWNGTSCENPFSYVTTSASPCQVYINASSELPYTISQNNTYYCLNASGSTTGTAISFSSGVQNSTLDCQNYNLNGDDGTTDYGVYLTGSYTKNNTIKNCNITNFGEGIYIRDYSRENIVLRFLLL